MWSPTRFRPGSFPLCAGLLLAALLAAPPLGSADERPTEIRYDVPGPVPLLSATYGLEKRRIVRVTDDALSPRRLVVDPGEIVAWKIDARGYTHIRFEREVARSMICHSLVNFHLSDDELRSSALRTGDEASFCELQPGLYRYRVVQEAPDDDRELSNRREGVIVVRAD